MTTLGDKIRDIRMMKGFSQEYVSQQLNLSASAYAKIERDETDVTINRLQEIAKIFEIDVSSFFIFDKQMIFNNLSGAHNNQNFVNNMYAHSFDNERKAFDNERTAYQSQIQSLLSDNEHLKSMVDFLKKQIEESSKKD